MARNKRDLETCDTPPVVSDVNSAGIPVELRDCAQWVLWKYVRRTDGRGNSKWTKVPIRALTRTPASTTDPDTWAEYNDVLAIYTRLRGKPDGFPGIGFVFSPDDPFCGVDLDDCRNKDTGEIAPWARDFLARLETYAEVSPSETGVKLILKGYVPGGRRRVKWQGGEVEVYDCGRFFVITGLHIQGTPTTVADAQDALDAIYAEVFAEADAAEPPPVPPPAPGAHPAPTSLDDNALLERIFASAIGDGFRRLWYGDTSAYEGDASRADYHLCDFLAWWCQGDMARVDRLFRQSGLMRPKWTTRRGQSTYGERTLERVRARLRGGYDPGYRSPTPAPTTLQAVTLPVAMSASQAASTAAATPAVPPAPTATAASPTPVGPPYRLANFVMVQTLQTNGQQLLMPRGLSAPEIAAQFLRATGDWPRRVGDQLFVPHPVRGFRWLASQNALFAWASQQLAVNGFGNPIDWASRGNDMLTKGEFFDYLATNARAYEGVQVIPHEPEMAEFYYACQAPQPGQAGCDGAALARFLDFFAPATDADRDLFLALLMTCVWGGPFGQRPAFVFVADREDERRGRGVGKTTAAQEVARLFGGFIKVRPSDDFAEVQKRLLSPGAATRRVCIVDNVKALRLSWDDLEDIITADWISGRQMYEGEGRRPNVLVWLMTYNGVQLSSDLATRSVIIELRRPRYRGDWKGDLDRFVADNASAVIGDLMARLRRQPGPPPEEESRWSGWERSVLSKVDDPATCYRLVRTRQGEADDDHEVMELVREAFAQILRRASHDPDTCCVFFSAAQAAAVLGRVAKERRSVTSAVPYLAQLGVPELSRHRSKTMRGFCWRGLDANPDANPVNLDIANLADSDDETDWLR